VGVSEYCQRVEGYRSCNTQLLLLVWSQRCQEECRESQYEDTPREAQNNDNCDRQRRGRCHRGEVPIGRSAEPEKSVTAQVFAFEL